MSSVTVRLFIPRLYLERDGKTLRWRIIIIKETGGKLIPTPGGTLEKPGLCGMPGGRIRPGESAFAAALREGCEETGYQDFAINERFREPICSIKKSDDHTEQTFLGRIPPGAQQVITDPWIEWAKWIPIEALPREQMYKGHLRLLDCWILPNNRVRTYMRAVETAVRRQSLEAQKQPQNQ